MVPTAIMLRQFYPSGAPSHKYLGTMTQEEMYAKAKELGEMLAKTLDEYGTDQQTAMTIFGYAAGLLLHTYSMQNGKDVQHEAAYFGKYIQAICATFQPTQA